MCTARRVPVHVPHALTPWVIQLSVCAIAAKQSAKSSPRICSACCCAIYQSIYQSCIQHLCLQLTFCSVNLPSMSSRMLPLCSVSSANPRTSAMISGSRHSPASLLSSFLPYLMRSSLRAAKQHLQYQACQWGIQQWQLCDGVQPSFAHSTAQHNCRHKSVSLLPDLCTKCC